MAARHRGGAGKQQKMGVTHALVERYGVDPLCNDYSLERSHGGLENRAERAGLGSTQLTE
jgi:hypothetical protein